MLNLPQGHIPMGAECEGESAAGEAVRGELSATYNANGESWAGLRRPPASAGDPPNLVPVKMATLRRVAERSGR